MVSKATTLARSYMPKAREERDIVSLVATARSTSRLVSIPVACIESNPRNPRTTFDEQSINELAASLKEDGQLQPVLVRPIPSPAGQQRYQLIAGERRWRAARHAGLESIQAAVWDVSEEQAYLLALVENLQREDLKPDEEAEALAVLVRERRWSVRKVAEAIHRDHQYVGRRLRVFEDPVLRDPVLDERLPVSTAEVLLRVPDASERAAWVQKAVEQGWRQMDVRKALRQHRELLPTLRLSTTLIGARRS